MCTLRLIHVINNILSYVDNSHNNISYIRSDRSYVFCAVSSSYSHYCCATRVLPHRKSRKKKFPQKTDNYYTNPLTPIAITQVMSWFFLSVINKLYFNITNVHYTQVCRTCESYRNRSISAVTATTTSNNNNNNNNLQV